MILGQISWIDCFAYLVFLAPQLLVQVGLFRTLYCVLRALPFFFIRLPLGFVRDHVFTKQKDRNAFVQQATLFEDFVIRCVRYAFAYIPAQIGRVFFSKPVALPFMRFRMLCHGVIRAPVRWQHIKMDSFQGLWISEGINADPDIIIFYAHGGGFSMGSSYFYLEFLIAWLELLKTTGYKKPAIFSLEYTLVPEKCYPTQLQQAIHAYKNICLNHDPAQIVVSGDSAGGTLVLSLLLHIANSNRQDAAAAMSDSKLSLPRMAVLISPWVTLVSARDKNTAADYLDADSLHLYARQYAGPKVALDDPVISPGNCRDVEWWRNACPDSGMFFCYGSEEVFAPEIRGLVKLLQSAELDVESREELGGIHAWPVAALFLSSTREERLKGLKMIVGKIKGRVGDLSKT